MKRHIVLIITFLSILICFSFYFYTKLNRPIVNANLLVDFEKTIINQGSIITNDQNYIPEGLVENMWVDKKHAREGEKSLGIMLKPHEGRSEVRLVNIPNNSKKYIAFSVYFPRNYKVPTDWNLFAQWFQGPAASPPIAFEVTPNTDKLQMRILTRYGEYSENNINVQYEDIIPTEKWIDFVIEMRIDDTGNNKGLLNVWKDNKKILEYKGELGYPVTNEKLYDYTTFRIGLYRYPHIMSTVKVYYDEIYIGDRFK